MTSRNWKGIMNKHLCRMVVAAVFVTVSTMEAEDRVTDRASRQRNVLSNASGGEVDGPREFFVDIDRGPGNMDADPYFANLGDQDAAADYHLKSQAGRWDAAART